YATAAQGREANALGSRREEAGARRGQNYNVGVPDCDHNPHAGTRLLLFAFRRGRLFVHQHLYRRLHTLIEADRHLELADMLQRLVEVDLAAVDGVALGFEGGPDIA